MVLKQELHICVTHPSGKTPIDFGVKRPKFKVIGEGSLHLSHKFNS